jgi:hypothetical protein
MARGATILSDLPAPGGVRSPSSATLGLLLAGLATGLLALAGAALLEGPPIGRNPATEINLSLGCTAFHVGSAYAGNMHIQLENAGPGSTSVHFDFVDRHGLNPWAGSYGRNLAPWASEEVVFKAPALGAAVQIASSGRDLHASAELLRDDGAPPETRQEGPCLGRAVLQPSEVIR